MASAASSKRMVSSVFITLSSPHRATVTQQQPVLKAHSAPAREKQQSAVRVSPSDNIPAVRQKIEEHLQAESYGSKGSKDQAPVAASVRASDPQSPKPAQTGPSRGKPQEHDRDAAELFPPPPAPAAPAAAALPSPLETSASEEPELPPPPPAETPLSHPLTSGQQPVYNREVETSTPSSGIKQDEQSHGIHKNGQDTSSVESGDVCGFCRKPVTLSERAIEALKRTYHAGCFQCRSCHIPLGGKEFYNKAGIPLCEECYQASLELCWACGEVIKDYVIRALERAYHRSCFICATCKQHIGGQFAQGEVGEVYCLQDYYRKYAPKCGVCNQLIIPKEDGTDSYNVQCLGRSYHENCYRCEVCAIKLSTEPNERGCYPLNGKLLCKSCHVNQVSGQQ